MRRLFSVLATTWLVAQLDVHTASPVRCWVMRGVETRAPSLGITYLSQDPTLNWWLIKVDVHGDLNKAAQQLGLKDAKQCL